jgi:hypothetical protein
MWYDALRTWNSTLCLILFAFWVVCTVLRWKQDMEWQYFWFIQNSGGSRNNVIGIATRLQAGQWMKRGSIPEKGKRYFSSAKCPDRLRLTQHAVQWVPEIIYPRVKWPGHEADQSPQFSAGVNEWSYTSASTHAWIACTGTAILYYILQYTRHF